MSDILDNAPRTQEEPKLIIRRVSHAPVWSVWATLEGTPSEEIFEGASEEEAMSWINTGGQSWLDDRRRKRTLSLTNGNLMRPNDVRVGSLAAMTACLRDVRSYPQ